MVFLSSFPWHTIKAILFLIKDYLLKITKKDWKKYKKVQHSGKYKMITTEAELASGLSQKKYLYIIKHYDDLADKFET